MADFDIEFCPHCGRELNYMANTCPECGEDLPLGASYCPNCGEEVDDCCTECGWVLLIAQIAEKKLMIVVLNVERQSQKKMLTSSINYPRRGKQPYVKPICRS